MEKTSYRLPEEVANHLAELAKSCHNGNKTAAICAAIEKAYQSQFGETLGWVSVRPNGKVRCGGCNNPIEQNGFIKLQSGGKLEGRLFCSRCAK
jgi:hypothetical protein